MASKKSEWSRGVLARCEEVSATDQMFADQSVQAGAPDKVETDLRPTTA